MTKERRKEIQDKIKAYRFEINYHADAIVGKRKVIEYMMDKIRKLKDELTNG